jgi:AhpD family alkylhydroperoxidase
MAERSALSLQSIALESARPREREVLDTALREVGFIPNMYANMVHAPALLETYLVGYRLFRREAGFTPAEQEVVFLSISFENECAYCMAAHSSIADTKSRVPPAVTEALRRGEPVPDARLNALSRFTRALVVKRGRPSREELAAFLAAGYTERQVVYLVLAVGVKTFSNYSNHLFGTSVDEIFSARIWESSQRGSVPAPG